MSEHVNMYDYCDPKHVVLVFVKVNVVTPCWRMLTPGGFRVPFNQELPITIRDGVVLQLCNTTPEGTLYWVGELEGYLKFANNGIAVNPGGAGRVSQSCLILHGGSITWVVSS